MIVRDDEHAREGGYGRDKWRIEADDVVVCLDAATGTVVWKRVFARCGLNLNGFDASGAQPLLTPCAADGVVYAMGTAGRVYAMEAETGDVLWESMIGPRAVALTMLTVRDDRLRNQAAVALSSKLGDKGRRAMYDALVAWFEAGATTELKAALSTLLGKHLYEQNMEMLFPLVLRLLGSDREDFYDLGVARFSYLSDEQRKQAFPLLLKQLQSDRADVWGSASSCYILETPADASDHLVADLAPRLSSEDRTQRQTALRIVMEHGSVVNMAENRQLLARGLFDAWRLGNYHDPEGDIVRRLCRLGKDVRALLPDLKPMIYDTRVATQARTIMDAIDPEAAKQLGPKVGDGLGGDIEELLDLVL
jgi:hypothetical protein